MITRWFTEDEVQFTVQASLSAMGLGISQRGFCSPFSLFLFSRSTGAGDQVCLASPISLSSSVLIFMLVTYGLSLPFMRAWDRLLASMSEWDTIVCHFFSISGGRTAFTPLNS
jgi:hypothetical protein